MKKSLPPAESPGLLLWRVTLAWQRAITAALRPLGLTHVQFVLLASTWWLAENEPVPPTQRRIADHAGTDAMTSQVLRDRGDRSRLLRARREPRCGHDVDPSGTRESRSASLKVEDCNCPQLL